jgi:hypothetical protein
VFRSGRAAFGQQAVLAHDLLALMDALAIPAPCSPVMIGADGRRASLPLFGGTCARVGIGRGYNIQDIPGSIHPQRPENELRYWYQYYFHSERGRPAGPASSRFLQAAVAAVVTQLALR